MDLGPVAFAASLRALVDSQMPAFRKHLKDLVQTPSTSRAPDDLRRCADLIVEITGQITPGMPVNIRYLTDPVNHMVRPFVVVGSQQPRCLLVAHHDVVLEPTEAFSFEDHGSYVTGPGVHDCKGAIVGGLMAMDLVVRSAPELVDEIALYIGADEEVGSPSGHELLAELAQTVEVALGLEGAEIDRPDASPCHPLKIGRKGIACYIFEYFGRAEHAGHADRARADANRQLIRHAHEIEEYASSHPDLALNLGRLLGGVSANQISATALLELEGRSFDLQELELLDAFVRKLSVHVDCPGVTWTFSGQINRPPFLADENAQSTFQTAKRVSQLLGLRDVIAVTSGGISDICLMPSSALRLDGLAFLGNGDHSDREWLEMTSVPDSILRIAGLMLTLLGRDIDTLSSVVESSTDSIIH